MSNSFVFFQYPDPFSHNRVDEGTNSKCPTILVVEIQFLFPNLPFSLALSVKYLCVGNRRKRSGKINQQIVFLSTLMRSLILGEMSKLREKNEMHDMCLVLFPFGIN